MVHYIVSQPMNVIYKFQSLYFNTDQKNHDLKSLGTSLKKGLKTVVQKIEYYSILKCKCAIVLEEKNRNLLKHENINGYQLYN